MNIKKNWLYWGIGILLVVTIVLFYMNNRSAEPKNVLDINLAEHKNLALHIHPKVTIEINGENYPIPSNVGISAAGMRVIHTHESDGTLHIESPFPHQFYLEDFFTIWGKRLTDSCVMEYCEDEGNSLTVYVNGEVSSLKGLTPFYDQDQIRIVYGSREAK
jgi:hypothetical protein